MRPIIAKLSPALAVLLGVFAFTPISSTLAPPAKSAAPQKVIELNWDGLMPAGMTEDKLDELMRKRGTWSEDDGVYFEPEYFPVQKHLNGKTIRIAGYIVPLDFNAAKISEFMLVPYFGACIHTPPPPPNQIIYVKMSQKFKLQGLSVPVMVTGPLSTKIKKSEIANTGYTMFADRIELYKDPAAK